MRLRLLHARNFRRHAEARIEFPDGVTALIGGNGAGKSSLLEAIAFALYGTDGLRTGKALVRRDGAPPGDDVSVTLDLDLGGQALRIHRELRGKTLAPSASLTVDGAVVVPPGAGSSEAVTQHVAARLGMGPDAFFTTVVARQGELARLADEAPAERKRMILRMLGVDRIDAAIDAARQHRRDGQATIEALRRVLGDPDALRQEAEQANAQLAAARNAGQAAQKAWAERQAAAEAAAAGLAEAEAQAARRAQAVADAQAAQRDAEAKREALVRVQAELDAALAAQQACEALAPAAAGLPALRDAWQEAQQALALARQHAAQQAAIARLAADLAATEAAAASLGPVPPESDGEAAEVALRMAETDVAMARGRLAAARTLLAQAQERRRRVQALGADAPCPACERPLAGHLPLITQQVHDASRHADDELASALAAEGQAAQRLDAARKAQAAVLAAQRRRDQHVAQSSSLQQRHEELRRRLDEARAHLVPAPLEPAGLADLQARLAAAQKAHDERQRHAGIAARVAPLAPLVERAQAAHAQALAAVQQRAAELQQAPDPGPALAQARHSVAEAQLAERAAERALHDVLRQHAVAEQAVQHVRARQAEQDRLQADLAQAQAQLREWTALVDGGSGMLERFRDHVVDRIGPAIQAEASRLLAAFTAGRYTEMLLDTGYNVYVTDGGVPYALPRFSGGEQDLAHLALRLAVSRLLAERSGGAEVRFLALDEVFGSLDVQRRDQVVGALRGLGGLYAQVLVVSHQEALQEALDHAITVDSSTVAM